VNFSAGYGFATFRTWESRVFVHDGMIAYDRIDRILGRLDSDLGRISNGSRSSARFLVEVRDPFPRGNFCRWRGSIGSGFRFLLGFDGMFKALHELRVLFTDGSLPTGFAERVSVSEQLVSIVRIDRSVVSSSEGRSSPRLTEETSHVSDPSTQSLRLGCSLR
jgi:hypothetical protein